MSHLPKHPLRGIVAASSGEGKTYVMIEMIMKRYRGVWDKIFVFSPSATVDVQWRPVKEYVKKVLKQKEEAFYEDFDEDLVEELHARQHAADAAAKENGGKGPSCLFLFDDVTDQGAKVRNMKTLLALYCRCRHINTSVLLSTQRYRFCPPEARTNQTMLIVGGLRSDLDWKAIKEENSRKIPIERLEWAYENCVEMVKHGFLILRLDLNKNDKDQILCGFDKRVVF
jgi:hypothetical protein